MTSNSSKRVYIGSGHYSSHVSWFLVTRYDDSFGLTACPHSFTFGHGEKHPDSSEVGICIQTSQDALHPVWEVKLVHISGSLFYGFLSPIPNLDNQH